DNKTAVNRNELKVSKKAAINLFGKDLGPSQMSSRIGNENLLSPSNLPADSSRVIVVGKSPTPPQFGDRCDPFVFLKKLKGHILINSVPDHEIMSCLALCFSDFGYSWWESVRNRVVDLDSFIVEF